MPALELWPCLNHFCLFSGSFVNLLDSKVLFIGPEFGQLYVLISDRILFPGDAHIRVDFVPNSGNNKRPTFGEHNVWYMTRQIKLFVCSAVCFDMITRQMMVKCGIHALSTECARAVQGIVHIWTQFAQPRAIEMESRHGIKCMVVLKAEHACLAHDIHRWMSSLFIGHRVVMLRRFWIRKFRNLTVLY